MSKYAYKARLAAVAAHDGLAVLVCAALLSCAFTPQAYAYVDPSVMTYTIQALAGVAVALSAVAGVAFRRTRKALMRTLNIDENARKEVDARIYRTDENGNPIYETDSEKQVESNLDAAPNKKRFEKTGIGGRKLSWPSRLWRAALVSVFLVGTLFVVAPFEMVAANSGSLEFTLADVWQPLTLQAAAIAAGLTLVLSLTRGKAFDFLLIVLTALGVCFYLQAIVLNQSLPAADGTPLELRKHLAIVAISSLVWLVVIVGAIVVAVKRPQLGRNAGVLVSIALVIVQGSAVISIWVGFDDQSLTPASAVETQVSSDETPIITQEGLFELSPKNNVVVFVLDAFDVIDMNNLLEIDPDVLSEMTGFTYFRNSTGSSVPTRYGVPFLLTGSWPRPDETWSDYINNRYVSTSFTDDIKDQDYSVYIYTDTTGPGGIQYLSSRTENIHPVDMTEIRTETTFDAAKAAEMAQRMAFYRDMPWLLKKPFWFSTDDVNRATHTQEVYEEPVSASERPGSSLPYLVDDVAYYDHLKEARLRIYDDGHKGSMHFIHLFGAHQPYTLDENVIRHTNERTDVNQQCMGTLKIVDEYLSQMKSLGVYDDATIIITADHGYWFWDDTIEQSEADGDMAGGPIMLVKPASAPNEPFKTSDARTGHIDFTATVIDAVGGDMSKYGPTVFQADDPNRIRYYYWPTHDGSNDLTIYEYAIDGEAIDWSAWERTGVSWDYHSPAAAIVN